MGPRFRGDDSRSLLPRANSPIQLSNSLSQRSATRILCRGPGEARLLSPPAKCEGMERRAAQPAVQRLAALTCLATGTFATRRSTCGFSVHRDRASGRGHRIQAAFAALHPRRVQPLKAAPRSWSGRRPGASRKRGCETTPAGAASGSTIKTTLDDALTLSRTDRIIVVLGLKSRRIFCVIPGERQRGPGSILRSPLIVHGVWVPAFAGTTVEWNACARLLSTRP